MASLFQIFSKLKNKPDPTFEGLIDSLFVHPGKEFSTRLLQNYLEILKIPSPSGQEKRIRHHLASHARAWGAKKINADRAGNLYVEQTQDRESPSILLTAHMDNYLHSIEPMTPVLSGLRMENRKSSILGGDDKVAIAAMMTILEMQSSGAMEPSVHSFLYTMHEENITSRGWSYGAGQVDPSLLSSVDLIVAMDVPSGNLIQERNFAVYHMDPKDPILDLAGQSAFAFGLNGIYLEWEKGGYIGGDATTFYKKFHKKVIDFGTGNFHEHTRREYTDLAIYLEQVGWMLQFLKQASQQSKAFFQHPLP